MENYMNVIQFLEPNKSELCNVEFSGFHQVPMINQKVKVSISDHNNYLNVNIVWEDEPYNLQNYKQYGLFGYYSTGYCGMEYDKSTNTLEITDTKGKTILISY